MSKEKEQEKQNDEFPTSWEQIFQHERFKQLNDRAKTAEAQAKELATRLEAVEADAKAREAAAADALKKQEDEKLSVTEKLQAEITALSESVKSERNMRQRLEIANNAKIPIALIDRLKGDTPDELAADAARLKEYLKEEKKSPGSPPLPIDGKQPTAFDVKNKTPKEIRQAIKDGRL